MSGEFQMTLNDIKVELADAVLEAAHWKREYAKAQRLVQQLERDNATHKKAIEQLHAAAELPKPVTD